MHGQYMRGGIRKLVGGAALSAAFFASSMALADPNTHDGFYLQLNAGLGYLNTSAEAGGVEATYSGVTLASALNIGGSLAPGFVLAGTILTDYAPSPGASFNGQDLDTGDLSLSLIGFGLLADFYPDPAEGLHFQAAAGWGGLDASVNGNSSGSDPTGLLLSVGAGYEFWVAREWSIGPMARFIYAPLSRNDVSFNTIAPALLASFTYH